MSVRALVVGGTNGIGYAVACRVAAAAASAGGSSPSSIIISGRTKPEKLPHSNMEFRQLDASTMRSIKQYTDAFKSSAAGQQLDLLIMSQGIMTVAGRTETPEGIDRKMALHYYGRQLLIRELLPVLKEDAKVVIVLDGQTGNPDKLIWEDLDLKTHYNLSNAANHCLVMTDAMVQYYATQQQRSGTGKRHFVHAFPGIVSTNLAQELPWYLRPALRLTGRLVGVSADTCAEYLLNGVTESSAVGEKEGRFWSNLNGKGQPVPNKLVWSEEKMEKIADHTWGIIDGALKSSS